METNIPSSHLFRFDFIKRLIEKSTQFTDNGVHSAITVNHEFVVKIRLFVDKYMKFAVIGSLCAGKTTISNEIAGKFNLN